jgi:hypothetical protein
MIEGSVEKKMVEKIFGYFDEQFTINYASKDAFSITREKRRFIINIISKHINENTRDIFQEYGSVSNRIFMDFLDKEIFQKELYIFCGRYAITASFNLYITEMYKNTKEYKLSKMYN